MSINVGDLKSLIAPAVGGMIAVLPIYFLFRWVSASLTQPLQIVVSGWF